jgi:exodeoxyribonuclease III
MRILSWNVNGLRAIDKKLAGGFVGFLERTAADVVGIQEMRATPDQITDIVDAAQKAGWSTHLHPAVRKGYSGTGLFSRTPFDVVDTKLGDTALDREMHDEGRFQIARRGKLVVVNGYFPNGNGKERDNSRIPFKLDVYERLRDKLTSLASTHRVLVMGDWNTAHRPIDLARPTQNAKTSGFRPEERASLDAWLMSGWVDTFRRHVGDQPDHYSWWSARFGVREKNIGWRIDLVVASENAAPFVRDAYIRSTELGSDHAPVGVDVDDHIAD